MALDGAFLRHLKKELEEAALGARVEKIAQPNREEMVFTLRTRTDHYKLLLSARANSARIHFTQYVPENPKVPPMLCMLLRKRLSGAKLAAVRQPGLERLLLTRGPKGMALFSPDRPPRYIRAAVREVADVSGAGDTVIATLAACVAKGLDWEESALVANTAAGVVVGKPGTAPVALRELNLALRENADNPKLYSLPDLLEKLEEWRRGNASIVFTNGCFDLLHPGHISLIRQCAALGERLVVGLNSDASVRRLKGSGRPIQNEQSRALLLAALQGVDAVVLFDEDTPLELIRRVRPDVLVKGSDYTVETVVGAELVREYGGRVHLAGLVDGCSTTNLVRRMGSDRS